jgi:hypothetical protein
MEWDYQKLIGLNVGKTLVRSISKENGLKLLI